MQLADGDEFEFCFNPNSEVENRRCLVGTARCAVPARAERAEQIVQGFYARQRLFRRLTLRSATGTAQRAIPANFGF